MQTFSMADLQWASGLPPIRDPQILVHQGRYYLTGTQPPFFEGVNQGVCLFTSADLRHWEELPMLIRREGLAQDVWYRDRFWAPEIHHVDGVFYLLLNGRNETTGHIHSCGIARARTIQGPYEVIHHERPLVTGANDLNLYHEDGQIYLYFTGNFGGGSAYVPEEQKFQTAQGRSGLFGARWNPDHPYELTDLTLCVEPQNNSWEADGIEGSWVLKRDGEYFMWYSSWTNGYEMGVAAATSPLGPWRPLPGNPLVGAANGCLLGHNAAFTSLRGEDLICYHIHRALEEPPRLGLARAVYAPGAVHLSPMTAQAVPQPC